MVMAKHTPVASRQAAWLVGICSTWAVRWYTYTFLRLLPFHDRYMPKIWTFIALYAGSTAYLSLGGTTTSSKIKWARTLISGSYDPSYRLTSLFNILLNLLCVMGCLDFVYRAHILHDERDLTFCRTGQVTSDSVKLLCRGAEHNAGDWSICDATGACSDWTSSSDIAKDQTIIIELSGLSPNSRYTYSSSSGLAGSFTTQRSSSDMQHFTLLSTSCMKPNWPYSPFNHPLRLLGIEHITSYLSTSLKKPEMMLFLGDFIYSDLPKQLASYTSDYYSKLYRQIYASPSWTQALRDMTWLHMFDDHEIVNDWAPSNFDPKLYTEAIQPFYHYQMAVNPPGVSGAQTTYFAFKIGQVAFFVLDNRSFRSPQPLRTYENSTAGWGDRTMLGETQLSHLRSWVEKEGREEKRLLVVVSGVPFTRNWSKGGDEFDSWAGYLDEREEVLSLLWARGGGMVISGDRHEHATTLLPPPISSGYPREHAVIEFSTSPLSFFHQPWKREYAQHLPSDEQIHLEWEGMSRFGVFDFDVTREHAKVNFTLVVDGQENWSMLWEKGRLPEL